MNLKKLGCFLLCACLFQGSALGQGFGKNKVQYENWDWYYIETENFDVYFYEGAEDLGRFVADEAERSLAEISRDFHYDVDEKIPFIVYKSHNDFQSTNVTGGLLPEGVGGFTEFLKHRVVVPYEGDLAQFRHVIHHELVHAVMFDMLYGRSLSGLLRGQGTLQLPLWFSEGLAEYISAGWDTRADMFMRDAVISGSLPPLGMLGGYFAYKGGQSVFRFIGDRYGREKVGELVGKVRAYRDLDRAFEKALGMDLKEFDREWTRAMQREYWPDVADRHVPEEIGRRLTNHVEIENYYNTSPAVSPDGSRVAFLSDRNFYADVLLLSTIDGSILRRLVEGQRTGQFEELHWLRPGISWSPDGNRITLAAKSGEHDHLFLIDATTGEVVEEIDFELDGIFSPAWSPDGERIAFVGMRDGASDIYVVELADGSLRPVTDDAHSDLEPSWSPDGDDIVFISDRSGASAMGPSWRKEHKDVFIVGLHDGQVRPVTQDAALQETPIFAPDGTKLLYTSDRNGCFNVFVHDLVSGDSWPITDLLTGAFDLSMTTDGSKLVFSSLDEFGWDVYELPRPLDFGPGSVTLTQTRYREMFTQAGQARGVPVPAEVAEPAAVPAADFSDFVFSRNTLDEVSEEADSASTIVSPDDGETGKFRIQPYEPRFSPDIVYGAAAYSQYFGVVGASQVAVSDILGNHQMFFATNLYFDLSNSDVFASYFYLPGRVDYGVAGFHNSFLWLSDDPDFVDRVLEAGDYPYDLDYIFFQDRYYGGGLVARRPLDRFRRVEADFSVVFIDRDFLELGAPAEHRRLIQSSFSYVTDTALWGVTGPMNGSMQRFTASWSPPILEDQPSFVTLQADIRRYWMLNKEYAFAARLFTGYSHGSDGEHQRFFLGGMEDWLNRDLTGDMRIDDLDDLYFTTFVTPLRGADYYEQVGSKVALANLEFRFPLLRYLSLGFPLPLELGNIRGALFADIGTAWDTNSSWRLSRMVNGERQLEDLILGYGMGARWNLGLFVLKLDVGWQQDFVQKPEPRWYLTLGPEF